MESNETFLCEECSKEFRTLGRYNQHLKTHSKPFTCDKCKKCFALRSDLSRHVHARHRLGQTKHACVLETCNFKATRRDNVRQHVRKMHPSYSLMPNLRRRKHLSGEGVIVLPDPQADISIQQLRNNPSALMQAAGTGNISLVQAILGLGTDISTKADDGSTALHCAVRADQMDMIQYLVKEGAPIDVQNSKGRTPLHEAVLSPCEAAFTFLVHNGATISNLVLDDIVKCDYAEFLKSIFKHHGDPIIESHGRFIFGIVAKSNSVSCMATLMSSSKVDSDWISGNDMALHYLATSGNAEVLKHLIESGKIDPNIRIGKWKATGLLHVAASEGHVEKVDLLLDCETIRINDLDSKERTPLQRAAAKGHVEVVRKLLRHKDCSIQSHTGSIKLQSKRPTTLHLAARAGHYAVAKLLLDHLDIGKMPIQSYNIIGHTPLHTAMWHGSTDVLELFLQRPDIDVNSTTRHGKGLLQLAVERRQYKELGLLLKNKDIDINMRTQIYKTLPQLAVRQEHLEELKLLLEDRNLDFCLKDNSRFALLQTAVSNLYWQIIDFLLDCEEFGQGKPLPMIKEWNDDKKVAAVKKLVESNEFPINDTIWGGRTLLHVMAERNSEDIPILLSHSRVQVNKMDGNNQTALHHVVSYTPDLWDTQRTHQQCKNLEAILAHGNVQVNLLDSKGHTALHIAKNHRRSDFVKLLLQHKDIDIEALNMSNPSKPGRMELKPDRARAEIEINDLIIQHGANKFSEAVPYSNVTTVKDHTKLGYSTGSGQFLSPHRPTAPPVNPYIRFKGMHSTTEDSMAENMGTVREMAVEDDVNLAVYGYEDHDESDIDKKMPEDEVEGDFWKTFLNVLD